MKQLFRVGLSTRTELSILSEVLMYYRHSWPGPQNATCGQPCL
jgi:hypothetical protein